MTQRALRYTVKYPMVAALALWGCGQQSGETTTETGDQEVAEVGKTGETLDHRAIKFNTIGAEETSLANISGRALLIVNVASECGYTPQYEGLQALYEKYRDQGLTVIGFPANNFGKQEPGSNDEILEFCQSRFHVTFPMMAKVSVKGDDQHPLFAYLTENADPSGDIPWNFHKFLLDGEGNIVARFEPAIKPLSDELTGAIEKLL
ncbi:MAG: glutathione peroxidase [Candidatus Zixiibacteriota bacterium]